MNVFLLVLQYLRIRLRDLIIKRESDKIYFLNSYALCTDNPDRFEMPDMILLGGGLKVILRQRAMFII